MRRVAIAVAIVAGVLATTMVTAFGSPAAVTPTATIHAQFVSADRATYYTLIMTGVPVGEIPVVFWSLALVQIDANGKVDPTCSKTENGAVQSEFIWDHGDDEGCNHALEGTHGHQGRITVKVEMRDWDCKTTYDGSTGNPPEGPTAQCEPRETPTPATDPCDDIAAQLAAVEAELAAETVSLRQTKHERWRAYYDSAYHKRAYWHAAAAKNGDAAKAYEDWNKSYANEKRLADLERQTRARIRVLEREQKRLQAALAACKAQVKFAPHAPDSSGARCTAALLGAAKARGQATGYAAFVRRFRGAPFAQAAAGLRSAAAHLRKAAARLPERRSRLLRDAQQTDAAANALTAGAAGLGKVNGLSVTAARSSRAAAAKLAQCHAS